ncbi:MAG: chemotaxis protein CheW [Thermosynechococcaceae cyanobacterium]
MLGTPVKSTALKILIFTVGDLHLGIRLDSVQKVVGMPSIVKSGNKFLGIAQIDGQELVVLDLFHNIYGYSANQQKGYFIVTKSDRQVYGIPTASLPTMKDIPATDFHPVPAEYRDRDTLGIAEQMAQVTLEKMQVATLFLLDPDRLMNLIKPLAQTLVAE